jgi:hypothetical protein
MMSRSLVPGASESNHNLGLGAVWLAVVLTLALVRLLSERHITCKRKGEPMNAVQKPSTNSTSNSPRTFWQYLLETIWAAGAGAIAAPLATLSQRTTERLSSPESRSWF